MGLKKMHRSLFVMKNQTQLFFLRQSNLSWPQTDGMTTWQTCTAHNSSLLYNHPMLMVIDLYHPVIFITESCFRHIRIILSPLLADLVLIGGGLIQAEGETWATAVWWNSCLYPNVLKPSILYCYVNMYC